MHECKDCGFFIKYVDNIPKQARLPMFFMIHLGMRYICPRCGSTNILTLNN